MKKKEKLKEVTNLGSRTGQTSDMIFPMNGLQIQQSFMCISTPIVNPGRSIRNPSINPQQRPDATGCVDTAPTKDAYNCIVDEGTYTYNDDGTYYGAKIKPISY